MLSVDTEEVLPVKNFQQFLFIREERIEMNYMIYLLVPEELDLVTVIESVDRLSEQHLLEILCTQTLCEECC
jgi:hypothetical protein